MARKETMQMIYATHALCNTCSFLAVILSFTLIDRGVAPAIVAVSQQLESYGRMHENNTHVTD